METQTQRKTILLIEDEPSLQEAIKLRLEKDNINVIAFSSAEEAAEYLKDNRPDLVWLDILLPGINGLEFLKQIREDLNLRDLPVVIVSVSASPERMQKAFDLHIMDFIVKSEGSLSSIIARAEKILDNLEKK